MVDWEDRFAFELSADVVIYSDIYILYMLYIYYIYKLYIYIIYMLYITYLFNFV